MEDHRAGELRSFKDFSEMMSNYPYLKPIEEKRRNRLLRELYQAAADKYVMEGIGKGLRQQVPEIRATTKRNLRAARLVRKALQAIDEALQAINDALQAIAEARSVSEDDLAVCEAKSKTTPRKSVTFDAIVRNLISSISVLEKEAAMKAILINPKWRTEAEKRLVTTYMAVENSALAKAHNLPLGKKGAGIRCLVHPQGIRVY